MSYDKFVAWLGIIFFLLIPVLGHCGDDYIDYCLRHPDHKLSHIGAEMAISGGLYGLMRSEFNDGQKWAVTLDDCRKITLISCTLGGAWFEGLQVEAGERTDFAIRDILVFNTMGILFGIFAVDVLFPLDISVEGTQVTWRF